MSSHDTLPGDMVRILTAPCGCVCAVDMTNAIPGFCRTKEEAKEDMLLGFHERTVSWSDFQKEGLTCPHQPRWGVPEVRG